MKGPVRSSLPCTSGVSSRLRTPATLAANQQAGRNRSAWPVQVGLLRCLSWAGQSFAQTGARDAFGRTRTRSKRRPNSFPLWSFAVRDVLQIADPKTSKDAAIESVREAAEAGTKTSLDVVSLQSQRFAKKWNLVMLVTFTEVYVEDVLKGFVAKFDVNDVSQTEAYLRFKLRGQIK